MARMIPPYVSSETPRGERQLYEKLKNDPNTKDWTVFHSFDIRRHTVRSAGEADLLIFIPNLGVLCVEVKGCDVSRNEGLWTYHYPQPKVTSVSPFRQASDAAHSIRNFLNSKDSTLSNIFFYSLVVFTEINFNEPSLEWDPWQVICRSDLLRVPISKLMINSLEKGLLKLKNNNQDNVSKTFTTKAQVDSIIKLLRGDFEYISANKNSIEAFEVNIKRFTEEQFVCLDHIEDNPRVIFKGPAGTGKTFLAIESAKRAILNGKSVALFCYNSILSNWLRSETRNIESEAESSGINFYAGSFSSFMLKASGLTVPENAGDNFWDKDLPLKTIDSLLLSNNSSLNHFDFIILDEAQDLLFDEYLDILDLILKGGMSAGHWVLFGDYERQSIYADPGGVQGLNLLQRRVGASFSTFRLRINCRNSPRIADAVTITTGMRPGYSRVLNQEDSLDVDTVFFKNIEHQRMLLSNILIKLLKTFDTSQIVILSVKKDSDSCCSNFQFDGKKLVPMRGTLERINNVIYYSSIYSFKGMEAPVIILTDVDRLDDDHSKSLLYVGMSRARLQLHILLDEKLRAPYGKLLDEGLKSALKEN